MPEQLPTQPVEKPIICNPYEEPIDHWLYDKDTGEASHAGHRRPADYWYRTERVTSLDSFTYSRYTHTERVRPNLRKWTREALCLASLSLAHPAPANGAGLSMPRRTVRRHESASAGRGFGVRPACCRSLSRKRASGRPRARRLMDILVRGSRPTQ